MWFAVNLLFESLHPDHPENEFLWEERIVLARADTEEQARREGELIGKAEEHEYTAASGDLVYWVFRQVESVRAIEKLDHGAELFSRFLSCVSGIAAVTIRVDQISENREPQRNS